MFFFEYVGLRPIMYYALVSAVFCCFALVSAVLSGPARAVELNADGLHVQPWFLESFLELNEDRKEAKAAGKRFAVIWEQRGCPYCRETHVVNFAVPEIQEYVKKHFVVLQLNIRGDREVTDLSGRKFPEKQLAKKYGVHFTPTVTFFGDDGEAKPAATDGPDVARMTGYYRPYHFLLAFMFVQERAYRTETFKQFVARKTVEREKAGLPVKFR
jgi:thioredoxin-related protein